MTRFRIDDPEIDVAALQARVEATIESKRGSRFTDADLERLRTTPLRPRLRREDLPRGFTAEMPSVRRKLPEIGPSPGPEAASASQVRVERPERPAVDVEGLLHSGSRPGLAGRFQRFMRAAVRRLTGFRPEATLVELRDDLMARIDDGSGAERERLERGFDLLKENLDRRVDRTADWAGSHLSRMTGQLEERTERQLDLLHGLVYELTNARLDLQNMQARLNETARRIQVLEERERTLEKLALGPQEGPGD